MWSVQIETINYYTHIITLPPTLKYVLFLPDPVFLFLKKIFFLSPGLQGNTPHLLIVCLFSKVWLYIWPLVLHLGRLLPSPGWQHTVYSGPLGSPHGSQVSKSVARPFGNVLEFSVLVVGVGGLCPHSACALGHPGEMVEGGSIQPCREGFIFLFLWNGPHRDLWSVWPSVTGSWFVSCFPFQPIEHLIPLS